MADAPPGFTREAAPSGFSREAPPSLASSPGEPGYGPAIETPPPPQSIGELARGAAHSILNPKTMKEHGASLAATAPLFLGASLLAPEVGLPLWGAEALTGGTLGILSALERGERNLSDLLPSGMIDAFVAALTGGVMRSASGPAKAAAKSAKEEFGRAVEDIPKALDAVKSRLPTHPLASEPIVSVPPMSATPLPLSEVGSRFGQLRGREYEGMAKDIAQALDRQSPGAGEAFLARISPYLRDPKPAPPRFGLLSKPGATAGAEAITTHPVGGKVPLGPYAVGGALGSPAALIRELIQHAGVP
jgi:hypothetical protein